MSLSPQHRNSIDQDVYKWVVQQQSKDKVVTPNAIRQKAYEMGQEYDPNFKASLNWYNNWKKRYDYNESPEAVALKHKKRSYTAAFKLHAVQRVLELESASQASLELDVSRRCLQRWKEELDVIASVAEHSSNAVYRRPGQGRKVHDSALDNQVLEWVQECWKQGVSVSSGMIREKARELTQQPTFKASLGWFVKWQKRHNVDLKEQTCSTPPPDASSPLRLRLLPEGEVSSYSSVTKKHKAKKRKLSYDDEALLENDEEFDRLLLTWLVERWEAGDIVNDRMLKDRALELTANPEFKASKAWLLAWKRKYNVSLENQTYGNEEGEDAEEIVDESVVYDNEVVLEDPPGASLARRAPEEPLTPTKEEAATALASLSEDHEATGLEIAEALQKLANAFGAVQGGDEQAKEAMAQLAAAYHTDNPEFILEGAGNVAVEEVISEEVVTDEPMVVIEETPSLVPITTQQLVEQAIAGLNTQPQTLVTPTPSISEAVQIIMTQASGSSVQTTAGLAEQPATTAIATSSLPSFVTEEVVSQVGGSPVRTMAGLGEHPPTTVMSTSPLSSFVTEEVVIGEAIIDPSEEQVEVVVQGSAADLLLPTSITQDVVTMATPNTLGPQVVTTSSSMDVSTAATESSVVTATESSVLTATDSAVLVATDASVATAMELSVVTTTESPVVTTVESSVVTATDSSIVTATDSSVVTTVESSVVTATESSVVTATDSSVVTASDSSVVMATDSSVVTATDSSVVMATDSSVIAPEVEPELSAQDAVSGIAKALCVLSDAAVQLKESSTAELPLSDPSQEILDIVQETLATAEPLVDDAAQESPTRNVYDEEFKAKVVARAKEVGSIQQAAREFSIPWRAVATWNTQETSTDANLH